MKKLTKLCVVAMLAFCPLVGTSAQEIYISPKSADSQEITNNTQIEYERPIYQNIDKVIAQNKWQKIGSDMYDISISTMNSLVTTPNDHRRVLVYMKLTTDNPYALASLREKMPNFQYMIDVFAYDLTDKTSAGIARVYIDKSHKQIANSAPFNNWYMYTNSKISKATYKWLCKKYSLEKK